MATCSSASGGDPGRPPPHHIRHGGGHIDLTPGHAVHGRVYRNGRFQTVSPMVGRVLYANGRLLESPRLAQFKKALDVLTGLFDRVGIQTNAKNGGDGMPDLSHVWWALVGSIRDADDRSRTIFLGTAT